MKETELNLHIEKLDAFLDGNESQATISSYIQDIKDESIKNELIKHVKAKANIRIAGENELKKKYIKLFDSAEIDYKEEIKDINRGIIPLRRILSVASTFVVLLGAFFLFKNYNSPSQFQTAYAEDPPISIVRSGDNIGFNEQWEAAMSLFNQKEYFDCLTLLEKLEFTPSDLDKYGGKVALYRGVCYMRLNNSLNAIESFNVIKKDNPYYDQKLWYLSLVYKKEGDIANAKKYLNQIINSDFHYKKIQAQEILKSLK